MHCDETGFHRPPPTLCHMGFYLYSNRLVISSGIFFPSTALGGSSSSAKKWVRFHPVWFKPPFFFKNYYQ